MNNVSMLPYTNGFWTGLWTLFFSIVTTSSSVCLRRVRKFFDRVRAVEKDIQEIRKFLKHPRQWKKLDADDDDTAAV